jgi:bacterioferritin-associated ferredoxin
MRQRWESIPTDIRQRLLTNAWCGQCRRAVTIVNLNGTMSGGDLLLVGKCAECQDDVARMIEGG